MRTKEASKAWKVRDGVFEASFVLPFEAFKALPRSSSPSKPSKPLRLHLRLFPFVLAFEAFEA